MPDLTATAADLLIVAVQDLCAAEAVLGERLGEPSGAAFDPALVRLLGDYRDEARARVGTVGMIAERVGAPAQDAPNIWMRAVLDDAARDARTTQAGELLDIALVGAIRKGAQAARVSYETAMALACDEAARTTLTDARDAHARTDSALAEILLRITAAARA